MTFDVLLTLDDSAVMNVISAQLLSMAHSTLWLRDAYSKVRRCGESRATVSKSSEISYCGIFGRRHRRLKYGIGRQVFYYGYVCIV